ncbi:flavin reductase domain protein FMN-binding protein [Stanieria cyanosphaera PCC 7437]|uniref:Flavin reductase domain protein FMN-binding protein n=1 Tax=Stanieria cyanosphaera (strain ATCC 29371 / PCC 7437) TaxID=111780 RepID=K9XR85_STAC7|nr:diflavin flavoprotein [Stanieria cyanosphaera]AFZ34187.1 flavin reductase domain protein FMN-binding protein [Stanieria cyanosphaera PCC 7437]
MSPNPAKDVQVFPIAANTRVMRSRTWERLKFEIEYALQKGTTANSYLIEGDKTALIDPPGESFTEIFLAALRERIDLSQLDYLILGHLNPNRGTTIKALLELAPQLKLVCSNPGAISLRKILSETELNITVIKGEETLDLGKGHHLEFLLTPNPRYPDQLCTYDPKTQVLYTDKLFGAHVCGEQVFDEGWTVYNEDRRYYFDCLMAPHARQIEAALDKIAGKNAKIYATGHGPLVRYSLTELTLDYRAWLKNQSDRDVTVALIYASAYGNTATIAQALARGITKAGVGVESINAEFAEPEEIKAILTKASGIMVGSPTLGGHAPTQIQTALGIILANTDKTKLVGVFGSFGWSGEAIDLLESKFRNAGYSFGFEPIRVKFKPTDLILKTCEETGTDFAQALKKSQKVRKGKQGTITSESDRTEQALGRIVGSLCIVTTKFHELKGAMLASWVSQATFNPPGITVAVAKERAIESLLHLDSNFVLNILQEGKHLGLMKHFLKPFAPGEDRFIGVATEEAENGCPILTDALAYVECQIKSRLECGDHWVIYATATQGKLLQSEGITAVHHRKSGSHY